jgi:serine/threonine protein kinase
MGVKYDPNISAWFGGFSDVHQATWSTSGTVVSVVAKRLRVNEGSDKMVIHKVRHLLFLQVSHLSTSQRMCIEALTWRQFDHLNIVKFLGVFREENEGNERLTLISMRKEDNLHNFIRTSGYNPHVDRKRIVGYLAFFPFPRGSVTNRIHPSVNGDKQCSGVSARPRNRARRYFLGWFFARLSPNGNLTFVSEKRPGRERQRLFDRLWPHRDRRREYRTLECAGGRCRPVYGTRISLLRRRGF